MRLADLADAFRGQPIYIVGTGPTANIFPMDTLEGKICIALNDAFKLHPAIGPVALMHHRYYAHEHGSAKAPYLPAFRQIRFPVLKATGRTRSEPIDWDDPDFYVYDWSHEIGRIHTLTAESDILYYEAEGSALQAALQLAWILGASAIYVIGCDSRTFGDRHYADYDKSGFRDAEKLPEGRGRDYDAYVKGTLLVKQFLAERGVPVFNLSPIIGHHLEDLQFAVLSGRATVAEAFAAREAER